MGTDFLAIRYHYPARPNEPQRGIEADPFAGVLGCEALRRAAIVAIAGGHTLAYFTTPGFPDAPLLAALPLNSRTAKPCPCGNLGIRGRECSCALWQIEEHWDILAGQPRPQIFAEAQECSAHYNRPFELEWWAESLAYIRAAEGRPSPRELSERTGAPALLADAERRLHPSKRSRADILAVASTCARLQGRELIEACHLAEALQLRVPDSLLPPAEDQH